MIRLTPLYCWKDSTALRNTSPIPAVPVSQRMSAVAHVVLGPVLIEVDNHGHVTIFSK